MSEQIPAEDSGCCLAGDRTGLAASISENLLLASAPRALVEVPVLPAPQNKGGRRSGGKCYRTRSHP